VLGAAHGDRLLSLTLANTTAVQATPKVWEERAALAAAQGVTPLVEPTLQRWFTSECFQRDASMIELVRAEALRTSVQGFVGCALALRDLSQLGLLERIRVPTLIVGGEHDAATPLPESRALSSAISGSRLVVLPGAHQCAAECPELFVTAWKAAQTNDERITLFPPVIPGDKPS
jgi:3-oxoadipate enol-lactonase